TSFSRTCHSKWSFVDTRSRRDDDAWMAKTACRVKIGRNCDLGPKKFLLFVNIDINYPSLQPGFPKNRSLKYRNKLNRKYPEVAKFIKKKKKH
ncbi:MAG: hypothetical protein ACI4QG_01440, partial [Candidatus Cryptobacteroides sp.]